MFILQIMKTEDDAWTRTNVTLKSLCGQSTWAIKFWNDSSTLAERLEENEQVVITNVEVVEFQAKTSGRATELTQVKVSNQLMFKPIMQHFECILPSAGMPGNTTSSEFVVMCCMLDTFHVSS